MHFDALVIAALIYVGLLFVVAWAADRAAARGRTGWSDRPIVYTLSLSVYCSAWTFYGAVGYASRSGLEFATIYLGPTVVLVGSWWGLRRLVRVAKMHRVTSVADLISARFGKSNPLAALITLISLIAATPYLALQLQSISLSFAAFGEGDVLPGPLDLWVAGGLSVFAILFGTRNLAADERHHGVVMAIAVEAMVKLIAFVALGVWVIWGLADGPGDVIARIAARAAQPDAAGWLLRPDRWTALIAVSAAAVVTLPRMFQVLVIEPADETPLSSAAWAFPAYLMAMTLFVLPIAVIGREMLPPDAAPDLYVLHLPLSQGADGLALLVFLGGLSSATSMVIISAIALATMISNHWLAPLYLAWRRGETGDAGPASLRQPLLVSRRIAILAVIGAGAVYQAAAGGGQALAAMGTVAFVGVAQLLPAMLGGLLWRGATRIGAYAGITAGSLIWMALVFLPSLGWAPDRDWGPVDPLAAAVLISLGVNMGLFIILSLVTLPDPQERLQGLSFVHAVAPDTAAVTTPPRPDGAIRAEALLTLARRIWGGDEALHFFRAEAEQQGKSGFLPDVSAGFLSRLERRLAGSVGAATAHAMLSQFAGQRPTSMAELMAVAGEAQRAQERARQLKDDSDELARTARRLQEANDRLTALSVQKDAFLGQISHELRTPMTSVRAFSELLKLPDLAPGDRARFAGIIHDEASRLTRLLDDLLDLSVLESGRARLSPGVVNLHGLISRAIEASSAVGGAALAIDRDPMSEHLMVLTDADRLLQVLINLVGNARKYCDAARPVLTIRVRRLAAATQIDLMDNGSGIPPEQQDLVFEKFSRLNDPARAGGAGLGLAISREVMAALGGSIIYLPGHEGAAFRLELPLRPPGLGGNGGGVNGK